MASDNISLGVGGLEVRPGDHICGVFSGDRQRDQILLPFLRAGLAAGDKCICVVDGSAPEYVLEALGLDETSAVLASKQLEVIRASEMYLRSGVFSAHEVIGAWKAAISDAMYSGRYDVVRAVESWSRRQVLPDMDELMRLESEMNRYLPLYPQVIVCLYDIDRFGAGVVFGLLRNHALLLVGGMIVENPYHSLLDWSDTEIAMTEEETAWYSAVTNGST